jgi:hypothetical protein
MKVRYKIKEVKPNIFAVIIMDKFDRAMTFCRVQEFYESPSSEFRGKNFSIWDYMKWYNDEYECGFNYMNDWSGFNVPLKVAINCFSKLKKKETPYDDVMQEIILKIEQLMFHKRGVRDYNAYIIGTSDWLSTTFEHEVRHGLYSTNKEYQTSANEIVQSIDVEDYRTFKYNLIGMGYTEKVIDDEIQAYLSTGWRGCKFGDGVSEDKMVKYQNAFVSILKKFI